MNFHYMCKKASNQEEITYSSAMREIGKKYPKEILREFRQIFKQTFDQALIEEKENPEEIALKKALQFIDDLDLNLFKAASAVEMGDPRYAGKFIAEIIKFLIRRISPINRGKSLLKLKNKIMMLNEFEMSRKKMPASASLGQSITLVKHLLFSHPPAYVRSVLNNIAANL